MTNTAQSPGGPEQPTGRHIAFHALGGSGPDAVMIHGFGSDRLSWGANQPALQAAANLHSLDLPGHGESGMDVGDGLVATLADRVADVLDRYQLRHATLIGHSLGGAIALMLAKKRPDFVAALVLIAPAGLGQQVDPEFLAAYPRLTSPEQTAALLKSLFVRPTLVGKPLVARVLEQLDKPGSRDALHLVGGGLAASAAGIDDAMSHVASIDMPRLVLWGEQDAINPIAPEKARRFGVEPVLVPSTGHLPHIENPKLVNASIAEFLMRLNAGSGKGEGNP